MIVTQSFVYNDCTAMYHSMNFDHVYMTSLYRPTYRFEYILQRQSIYIQHLVC